MDEQPNDNLGRDLNDDDHRNTPAGHVVPYLYDQNRSLEANGDQAAVVDPLHEARATYPEHTRPAQLSQHHNAVPHHNPRHRRGPWSEAEDTALMAKVHEVGPFDWGSVANTVGCRTPKQCRERYFQNLKPDLNHAPITPEEGVVINEMVAKYGKKWADIARTLKGRSDNAVKNWWNGNQNRKKRRDRDRARTVEAHSHDRNHAHSYTHARVAGSVENGPHTRLSYYDPHVGSPSFSSPGGPSSPVGPPGHPGPGYGSHTGPQPHGCYSSSSSYSRSTYHLPEYHQTCPRAPASAPPPIHALDYQAYRQSYHGSRGAESLPSPASSDATDRGHPNYSVSPGRYAAHPPHPPHMSPCEVSSHPQSHALSVPQYQLPPLEHHGRARVYEEISKPRNSQPPGAILAVDPARQLESADQPEGRSEERLSAKDPRLDVRNLLQ